MSDTKRASRRPAIPPRAGDRKPPPLRAVAFVVLCTALLATAILAIEGAVPIPPPTEPAIVAYATEFRDPLEGPLATPAPFAFALTPPNGDLPAVGPVSRPTPTPPPRVVTVAYKPPAPPTPAPKTPWPGSWPGWHQNGGPRHHGPGWPGPGH